MSSSSSLPQQTASLPRETQRWLLCEDTGRHADAGSCPVHGGDRCLIVVAWVDNSHVRRDLAAEKATVSLYRWALKEIAERPTVERNPDGVDQAAETMQLIAQEALHSHA